MGKIGMIAGMLAPVLPENPVVVHQKQAGHGPGVPYRPTNPIAFERSLEAAPPDATAKKLLYAAAPEPKGGVKTLRYVGDCPSLRPEPSKEGVILCDCPLGEEEDRGIGGDCRSNLPQVLDGLATEDSAEVAQKHTQRWLITQLLAQRPRLQIDALYGPV